MITPFSHLKVTKLIDSVCIPCIRENFCCPWKLHRLLGNKTLEGPSAWKCSDQGFGRRIRRAISLRSSPLHSNHHHLYHPCIAGWGLDKKAGESGGGAKLWVNFQNKEWGWTSRDVTITIFIIIHVIMGRQSSWSVGWRQWINLATFGVCGILVLAAPVPHLHWFGNPPIHHPPNVTLQDWQKGIRRRCFFIETIMSTHH